MTTKHDQGKLRWDLVDFKAIEPMMEALTYGANIYGDSNWRTVENAEDRYFAAVMRHLSAWRQGEIHDPESGINHLGHAMCSLMFLLAKRDSYTLPASAREGYKEALAKQKSANTPNSHWSGKKISLQEGAGHD